MYQITIEDMELWGACRDPKGDFGDGWTGTAADVMATEATPLIDRLWVVLRPEILPSSELRRAAIWAANQLSPTDQRSIDGMQAAEDYAAGNITSARLLTFERAAWSVDGGDNFAWRAAAHCCLPVAGVGALGAIAILMMTKQDDELIALRSSIETYINGVLEEFGL